MFKPGVLVESAGLRGESQIHMLSYPDMKTSLNKPQDDRYFSEGCDMVTVNGVKKIFQLTWQERVVFQYNENLQLERTIDLPQPIKEGWGITHRDEMENGVLVPNVYISDGTNKIYVVDARSTQWTVKRTISVSFSKRSLILIGNL